MNRSCIFLCKDYIPTTKKYKALHSKHKLREQLNNDYNKLIERDLYGKKGRRINSIYNDKPLLNNHTRKYNIITKHTLKLPVVGIKCVEDIPYAQNDKAGEHKANIIDTELNDNSLFVESETRIDAVNQVEVTEQSLGSVVDEKLENRKEKSKLAKLKELLKYMMKKHDPLMTKKILEDGNYRKGYRERLEISTLPMQHRKIEMNRLRDDYLKLKIQARKETYIKSVQRRVKAITIDKPLLNHKLHNKYQIKTPHIHSSIQNTSLNNSIIDVNKLMNLKDFQRFHSVSLKINKGPMISKRIKAAVSRVNKKQVVKKVELEDCKIVLEKELMKVKENYSTKALQSESDLSTQYEPRCNKVQRLRNLIKSIDCEGEKMRDGKDYIHHLVVEMNKIKRSVQFKKMRTYKMSL